MWYCDVDYLWTNRWELCYCCTIRKLERQQNDSVSVSRNFCRRHNGNLRVLLKGMAAKHWGRKERWMWQINLFVLYYQVEYDWNKIWSLQEWKFDFFSRSEQSIASTDCRKYGCLFMAWTRLKIFMLCWYSSGFLLKKKVCS